MKIHSLVHQSLPPENYKSSFSINPLPKDLTRDSHDETKETVAFKPIVDIQYINATEFDALSARSSKKPPKGIIPENYSSERNKKQHNPNEMFSLSSIGLGLATIGTLNFLTSKEYLSGAILFGSGLLAYGIGQNLNSKR